MKKKVKITDAELELIAEKVHKFELKHFEDLEEYENGI